MANRSNILLICSDQHNPFITGCYGDSIVESPNLDRLARDGVRYDNAYCNDPICVPSRMSMLTGRYPHRIGVFGNADVLDSRIPTFAHIASGAGYRTALAGRMHLVGPDQFHGFQERIGSDYTAYALHCGKINRYLPLRGLLGNGTLPDPLVEVGQGKTVTQQLDIDTTQTAVRWLEGYAGSGAKRPFLLTVGYFSPHCPYIAEAHHYRKYDGRVTPRPAGFEELEKLHPFHTTFREKIEIDRIPAENLRKATTAYYGLVDLLDEQIGLLLEALTDLGLEDDTTIIYLSDHGEMLGRHGRWHKQCFYEDSARVPLIVSGPEAPGTGIVSAPVSLIDIFPTICAMTGTVTNLNLDGQSLYDPLDSDRPIYCEYHENRLSHRMIRRGALKLNLYRDHEEAELYDLEEDPMELRNLAGQPGRSRVELDLRRALTSDGWSDLAAARHQEYLDTIGFRYAATGASRAQELIEEGVLGNVPGYEAAVSGYENRLDE